MQLQQGGGSDPDHIFMASDSKNNPQTLKQVGGSNPNDILRTCDSENEPRDRDRAVDRTTA